MNRREALQQVAWLMGGTISAPAVLGILNGCSAKQDENWQPVFLTSERAALVAEVAEIIIPRTDTPGAKDIGVAALIDRMLKDVYPTTDQERFIVGLDAFDAKARTQFGRPFLSLEQDAQRDLIRTTTETAMAAERAHVGTDPLPRPFILMTRELTLLGYFTSQAGASKVLQYNPVPGPYHGCIPLTEAGSGKTWATEQTQRF
jgi:gluconate 2-dehydrogenase gamma chain